MKTGLRILHVITAFDRGGAENHLADLVRHQRASGMDVTIAFLRGRGSLGAEMERLGVDVRRLPLRFYGDPRPLVRLRKLIKRGAFELIHAHLPPAELYVRLALLGTSAETLPLVISKHNDCPFHALPGELAMARWVARRASAMIAISEAVRRYMDEREIGAEPCRMNTIPYGIDVAPFERVAPETIARLRHEWSAGRDTIVIGFVGRLVAQKSIETLIRAFALFLRQQRCDAKLVIVGNGPLRTSLMQCAKESGVAERVVWTGFREDIPALMRSFDLFALTSVFEGFGLVLVEAMAARCPVVATRVSAIPEVVVDGETGYLARVRRPQSVAAAFAKLADNATRQRFGAAGYRRAFEHFTLERMWQSTDAVYARALGAHSVSKTNSQPTTASAA